MTPNSKSVSDNHRNGDYVSPLLSVDDVSRLLNLSKQAVYEHRRKLGGFYPAGIKVLRFSPEVIYGFMEGPRTGGLALRIPPERYTDTDLQKKSVGFPPPIVTNGDGSETALCALRIQYKLFRALAVRVRTGTPDATKGAVRAWITQSEGQRR